MQLINGEIGNVESIQIHAFGRSFRLKVESREGEVGGELYAQASSQDEVSAISAVCTRGSLSIVLPIGSKLTEEPRGSSIRITGEDVLEFSRVFAGDQIIELKLILPPGRSFSFEGEGISIGMVTPLLPRQRVERIERVEIPELRAKFAQKAKAKRDKAVEKRDRNLQRAKEKKQKADGKRAEAQEARSSGKHDKASRKESDALDALREAKQYEVEAQQEYNELMREAGEIEREGKEEERQLQARLEVLKESLNK